MLEGFFKTWGWLHFAKATEEICKEKYTLGTGHTAFFLDKLKFISDRYDSLCAEMLKRGYNCNRVPKEELHKGINANMFWDYKPTEEALEINRQRIADRMPKVN